MIILLFVCCIKINIDFIALAITISAFQCMFLFLCVHDAFWLHVINWIWINEWMTSLLISAPSLGVIIVNNWLLCLSVRMSVSHTPSNCFFFVSRWNRAIFWPTVLHVSLYKTVFFDFWFRLPKAQTLLPKIVGTKSPISWLVWQIDQRCLGLPGGFQGWPIQWNHAKCCRANPCCHGNEIWARRGDPVAYRLVCSSGQLVLCWASVLKIVCLWRVAVHSVAGVDSTHTGNLRRLLVPCVGRRCRLGICSLLHTTTTRRCYHQSRQKQRPNIQGIQSGCEWQW